MKSKNGFKDKVCLVTGGSSGIGKATAKAFAEQGAHVVISDVSTEQGEQVAAEIRGMGGAATFIKCDVSRGDQVETLFLKILNQHKKIDYAFNNAGIEGAQAPTAECTEENWDKVIGINLKGVWQCMKQELQQMLKQGRGAIVNNSSIAGLVGFTNIPAYSASKHGIIGLTRTAALEYAKNGIRINAVCPGVIATPMVDRFLQTGKLKEEDMIVGEPIGRMGRPDEIAKAVLWLCSDDASFVTGVAFPVDGGWVAQ